MKKLVLRISALIFLMLPALSFAQVANGTFDSGPAAWTWTNAVFAQSLTTNCGNANYSVFNAGNGDTPYIGTGSASGYVAKVTDRLPYGIGLWTICRQIEQNVVVPTGTQLKFTARIGDSLSRSSVPRYIVDATLSVIVVDGSNATTILSVTGRSRECEGFPDSCPKFISQSIDMSAYWGKSIKLIFRGATAGQNTSTTQSYGWPSTAYVDNIRLQ